MSTLTPTSYELGDIVQTKRGTVLIVCETSEKERLFLITSGKSGHAPRKRGRLQAQWSIGGGTASVIGNIKQLGEGK